jgi:hypothetical protein
MERLDEFHPRHPRHSDIRYDATELQALDLSEESVGRSVKSGFPPALLRRSGDRASERLIIINDVNEHRTTFADRPPICRLKVKKALPTLPKNHVGSCRCSPCNVHGRSVGDRHDLDGAARPTRHRAFRRRHVTIALICPFQISSKRGPGEPKGPRIIDRGTPDEAARADDLYLRNW